MRRSTLSELQRDPVNRYVAGASYAHFCAAPGLWGVVLWGRPTLADAVELGRSLVFELGPPAEPHVSVFDASRVVGIDPRSFKSAGRYLEDYGEPLAASIERLAMIRSTGMNGAVVAGAFEILPRPFPVEVCDDASSALEWLLGGRERPSDWPSELQAFLDGLHREASQGSIVPVSLRAHLETNLADARIGSAAKALGVSERTLQRQLSDAGTTFTEELAAARIRVARAALLESEASLTEIAMDVGCKSLQQFSALFRKRVGCSPSHYRATRRER